MKNILKLEKRGCNFWKDSPEIKKSDLENYRLVGCIKGKDKNYILEICTHTATDKKRIKYLKEKFGLDATCTWIDNEYTKTETKTWNDGTITTQKNHYRDMTKLETYAQPTKKGILETINKVFGCDYDGIEFVDNVDFVAFGFGK